MIIKPRTRDFICTTAHPVGCKQNVEEQIQYVATKNMENGPKKVLILGASTGYGLACRIVSAFGCGADTLGVFFEKPCSGKGTASSGWYHTAWFEQLNQKTGTKAVSINGDAFSDEIKEKTLSVLEKEFGKIDLVIYSLAAPRRTDPKTGEKYHSVIKPIGKSFAEKTIDFHKGVVYQTEIQPATEEEIQNTVKVMGGEDWYLWIDALKKADLLAQGAKTVAFSYIGPKVTHAVYLNGSIGRAKEHLQKTANELNALLADLGGEAYISVNKALVTQASSAIPVVPLYISALYRVMKQKGIHEGCIEQCCRLFERLYSEDKQLDAQGRIRIDDWEMREDVQQQVNEIWQKVSTENVMEITDLAGYREESVSNTQLTMPTINIV